MRRNDHFRRRDAAQSPAEERASDVLADWWRQIDRWVNEGGADEQATMSGGTTSRRVEP